MKLSKELNSNIPKNNEITYTPRWNISLILSSLCAIVDYADVVCSGMHNPAYTYAVFTPLARVWHISKMYLPLQSLMFVLIPKIVRLIKNRNVFW
mgnify:CR=1 FL=1